MKGGFITVMSVSGSVLQCRRRGEDEVLVYG